MRFGICGLFGEIRLAEQLGYDYLESNATALYNMDEETFCETLALVKQQAIPCEALNCLFGGDFDLKTVEEPVLRSYADTVFRRAAALGVKLVVFGSGMRRNYETDYQTGYRRMLWLCRVLGDCAAACGLQLAVEPLRKEETNMINTVAEGLALVQELAHPAVGLIADLFHMDAMAESVAVLKAAEPYLLHVHIASPGGRKTPRLGDGDVYDAAFATLREIGYDKTITIESTESMEVAGAEGLALLKQNL